MDTLARDIIVGAIGSVIGALFVLLGSQGWQLGKEAQERIGAARKREEDLWRTRKLGIRQGITNAYLFDILKYVLLGNLFLALPTVATFLDMTSQVGFIAYRVILSVGGALAFACFFVGVGKASRYMKLRAIDDETAIEESKK